MKDNESVGKMFVRFQSMFKMKDNKSVGEIIVRFQTHK